MAGLIGVSRRLWWSFSEQVLALVVEGLEQLALESGTHPFATMKENDLNRHVLQRMNRIVLQQKRALLSLCPGPLLSREHLWDLLPVPEAQNQPSPDDPERTPREDKRPDFQWRFQDDLEPDSARAMRTFVVECKRLRHASGKWVFNANYVGHGINRFVVESHLYGMDDVAGGMVGYVQAMGIEAIWKEIGPHLEASGLAALPMPVPRPGTAALHAAFHELSRPRGRSPFRLYHLWVDLRRPEQKDASGGREVIRHDDDG